MQTGETAFLDAYRRLNKAQREAVECTDGPVLVIAGPGTGKTQILSLRIVHILKTTDTAPESILAITFTEAGARAMRERLRIYIGPLAYRVAIFTFHGFAEHLIRAYPDAYTRVIGGRIAHDTEKIAAIETILEDTRIRVLRPIGNPHYYVPHILKTIATLKQEYITPDAFSKIIDVQRTELAETEKTHTKGPHAGKIRSAYQKLERAITKNEELLYVYRTYEAVLTEQNQYDFNDMILETITALQHNTDMLLDLQETYQYIHADEHQDVNGSQNKILELLAGYHERPNLFVVGDEKQAIYRFQGASLENFLYFEERYPETTTVTLTENYRSGQEVLDVAHSLITSETTPADALRVPLIAAHVPKAEVSYRAFPHQAVEDEWVVTHIQTCIENGTAPEDIAVIVRTNTEVELFATLLRKHAIAATASADGDILKHPLTNSALALITAVVEPQNETALFRVLHEAYWKIPQQDIVRLLQARSHAQPLLAVLEDRELQQRIGITNTEAVTRLIKVITETRTRGVSDTPQQTLEYLLRESGFLTQAIEQDPLESSRVLRRLYDEVEALVRREGTYTLRDVLVLIETYRAHHLALSAPYIRTNDRAVTVMTAHKSKGLEYAAVFVPHLTDTTWGGKKRSEYFTIPLTRHRIRDAYSTLDDERRLLYVAMTRSKQELYLSNSATNTEGRELVPSRLLAEIDSSLLSTVDTKATTESFDPAALLSRAQTHTLDTHFLRTTLSERGLSATALNNYLQNPWNYIYRNVLRIPEIPSLQMRYGTVIHNILERATALHTKTGTLPSLCEIEAVLSETLSRLPITTVEYSHLHEQALGSLSVYWEHLIATLPEKTREEYTIRAVLKTDDPLIPEVPLTGKLDRLDLDADGRVVRVIDYKTGKPKSRNTIEGKTKHSNGNYKRQLVFYALLFSLVDEEPFSEREYVLSFVEPQNTGRIREEAFTVTETEIKELRETVTRAASEIAHGTCLTVPCDPTTTEYCDLAEKLFNVQ